MSARVYVGCGSNVERETRLRQAIAALRERFGRVELSPVYDSAAVGFDGFDELGVEAVNAVFRDIENQLGRDRSLPKFASRSIDLDILTYDDLVLNTSGIRVPRPEILENAFVLKPLQDLAPDTPHPENGETYAVLWQRMAPTAPRLDLFPLDL
jgi:2-amino-4-hydroxy-6-hydroxymethyldihydropteridine diphosphokinase